MARNFPDFLSAYLRYTDKTESPRNYHVWTCLSTISACLQRKVYLKWGFKTLYPNMYIVLVGPSGCRKGTAMTIGKDLLDDIAGVKVAAESVTRESLIRDMRESVNQFADPTDGGMLRYHSSISVMSEELSVFLGQQNIKFLADLTDWYDSKDTWEYRTKGSGVDKVVGVCVNFLGATAPDWLRSILPQEAFGGGFTSRIIWIMEESKRQIISDPTIPKDILDMREPLIHDLQDIANMAGKMVFHEETMRFYKQWYESQTSVPPIKDPLFAGYCERRAAHSLKLSMVCAASRSSDRVVTVSDFQRAIALLESVEPKMPRAFMGLGRARYSEMTAYIYDYMKRRKSATTSEILEKFHSDLDEYTLNIIMKTLIARERVSASYNTATGQHTYRFLDRGGEE